MAISRVIIVMFHPISADGDLEAPEVFGGKWRANLELTFIIIIIVVIIIIIIFIIIIIILVLYIYRTNFPFIGIKTSYGLEQAQSFLGSPSPPVSARLRVKVVSKRPGDFDAEIHRNNG